MREVETSADWCAEGDGIVICGTRMVEHSRRSVGVKWCFSCRKRADFQWIVTVPDGLSYYGPIGAIKCSLCGQTDGDLFPGWIREYEED